MEEDRALVRSEIRQLGRVRSELAERQANRDALAEKALMLAQDAETYGGMTRDLGADRVIGLAQVYAALAARP